MHAQKTDTPIHSRRSGFTLVEIMVVIVIIGILAAILVPVLGGILRRTNEAAVKVEIHSLESAISDFKAKFGCHPPDYIKLYETQQGWVGDAASRAKIARIWPRFRFVSSNPNPPLEWDVNGDGNFGSGTFTLSGAECLVFFLGGMPKRDASHGIFTTGFAKNPSNPFGPRTGDETRDGPFFEFPSSRLVDVEVNSNGDHVGDTFPEFIDTLSNQTAPYLYLSSNEGRGYSRVAGPGLVFHLSSQTALWGNHWNRTFPYRQSAGEDLNHNSIFDAGEDVNNNNQLDKGPHWKAKSFQIISPGFGPHDNTNGEICPYGVLEYYRLDHIDLLTPQGADNITNFSAGGRLRP